MATPLPFDAWLQENPLPTVKSFEEWNSTRAPFNLGSNLSEQREQYNNYARNFNPPNTSQADYQTYLNSFGATPTGPTNPTGNIGTVSEIEDVWQPGVNEASQIFNQGIPDISPQIQGLIDQNQNPNNPFLQGLQNFQSQANPYADQLFDMGAERIRDQINSQFGRAGQGSSSLNFDKQLQDLSDYGAQFYGNLYNQQQDRALQSLGMGNQAFQNQFAQQQSFTPALLQTLQSQPYANLQNYTDIVSRLTGSAPFAPEPERASGFSRLLGLGSVLGGLGFSPF